MAKPKGSVTTREKRSQLAQLDSHQHGTEKGVKWPMAVKDGSREDSGPVADTALRGTHNDSQLFGLQRRLDADKNLSAYGLKAKYTNDTLQITGIVDTLADKQYLKKLLAKDGVEEIADGVSISTDGPVQDSHVALEVREELDAANLEGANIDVQIAGGTVFLVGDIENRRQEEAALAAARRARGVVNVVGHLNLLPTDLDIDDLFHSQVNNDHEWDRR